MIKLILALTLAAVLVLLVSVGVDAGSVPCCP
jgi:hypothetical protein